MDIKTALRFGRTLKADDIRAFARAVVDAFGDARDGDDFTADTDEGEFRFIAESAIERIHHDEIVEFVDDCYLPDKSIPETIKRYFDYDSFVRDCRIGDGYGHHFSSYDGSEENEGDYYMFRVG